MCIGRENWEIPAVCAHCDGPLRQKNASPPSRTLAVSIVYCVACGVEYELTVRLTEMRRRRGRAA